MLHAMTAEHVQLRRDEVRFAERIEIDPDYSGERRRQS